MSGRSGRKDRSVAVAPAPSSNISEKPLESLSSSSVGDPVVPKQLRALIPPDLWSSYSPVRRESFNLMLVNPNAFFYRNRPPGDPQRVGAFTAEEERQFLDRLRYFREELQIEDGKWGLFAIPFRGRLGYQCSNFYRLLLESGKVTDPNYERDADGKLKCVKKASKRVPSESIKRLEEEALDFIKECIAGYAPGMSAKVAIQDMGRRRRRETHESETEEGCVTVKEAPDQPSELVNARDPVTEMPMKNPYMDIRTGAVLDFTTWKMVFRGEVTPNVQTRATGFDQLLKMTKRNYRRHWMDIANVNI